MTRINISDIGIDAIVNLPKKAKNKVMALIEKLRSGGASAVGVHLEQIAQFGDRMLRTARVDDNYRAIVGVGEDMYTILFVGTHEEAYTWGARKKYIWNNNTQSYQIVKMKESTETVIVPSDPKKKAFFAGVPEEKLLQMGVPQDFISEVMRMVSIDDLEKLGEYLPDDAFENLFNAMDGVEIDSIICKIEEGKVKAGGDKYLSSNNRRHFVEITDDADLQRIIDQGFEKWQIFLHPTQRQLVETEYKGTVKVSGGAGTGKTIAAIHRLKFLCAKPESNVLFTTYTTTLKENLVPLIGKLDVPTQRYTLNNIDKVLVAVATKYGVKTGFKVMDYFGTDEPLKLWTEVLGNEKTEFDERFLYDEYVNVILYHNNRDEKKYLLQSRKGRYKALTRKQRSEVWRLVEKYIALKQEKQLIDRFELFNETTDYLNENNIHPYTNVIADEFQDFSNPELRFLRSLVAKGKNDLFLTGDPIQRIYTGRSTNFRVAGINVRGVRSVKLKVNYRTTEQIKRVAVGVVNGKDFDDMNGGKETMEGYVSLIRQGVIPQYKVVEDSNAEVRQVIEWLKECDSSDIKTSEICVAVPTKNILKDLQTQLHNEGVDYKLIKGEQRQGNKEGVSICTLHSLKGLEYRVIILMGVNERNFPSEMTQNCEGKSVFEQKEYLSSKCSLLYVAITRARQLVFMVGSGVPTGLVKVAEDSIEK